MNRASKPCSSEASQLLNLRTKFWKSNLGEERKNKAVPQDCEFRHSGCGNAS